MNIPSFLKESILYESVGSPKVRCSLCERRCIIDEGKVGFCQTRINHKGTLYCLTYGNISSISNNPIEKKPFYHFFPGTKALTIGTWSCNFTCPFCQNWDISKIPPSPPNDSNYLSPQQFSDQLKKSESQGTSFSFNEPTLLLEYAIDVMKLTKPLNYYQTYVTNMYMTEEALRLLIQNGCDGFCANIKGDVAFYKEQCHADSHMVWRNLKIAKELGAHVEVVTLIIPHKNDTEEVLREIAVRIKEILGENTPWHCNQYYPAYKAVDVGMANYRTPVDTLEMAYKIGRDEGLKFVYIGNVHGHKFENTYCPTCNTLLIERTIFGVMKNHLKNGNRCPYCGELIPIITALKKRDKLTKSWLLFTSSFYPKTHFHIFKKISNLL
ncbi:MAG TPA: AmmeMemoRadiSam system radical SAM enzyme [Candidatus Deferrimicrobium sp.]|nr:AmmeMemoRadiSam system radical SAM enzyme [Candidatus Deferrimicrobium sp.]